MGAAGSEPAYPVASDIIGHHSGMSMRQYYAGQALAGMMATTGDPPSLNSPNFVFRNWAALCFKIADAMILADGDAG